MFFDFQIFLHSGRDLWAGQYTGLYPLPMNGLFALLALLPPHIALLILCGVGLALFVATLKRDALIWVFYWPILSNLWLGQVDLMALWLLRHGSPASLALLTLKPQLFLLAIPQLVRNREIWKPFFIWTALLYLPITLIRPSWIFEWLAHMNDGRLDGGLTALTQIPVLAFVILAGLAATNRLTLKRIFWAMNPLLRWYDFTMRAGETRWLIPLSWAAWWVCKQLGGNPWPISLLGLMG